MNTLKSMKSHPLAAFLLTLAFAAACKAQKSPANTPPQSSGAPALGQTNAVAVTEQAVNEWKDAGPWFPKLRLVGHTVNGKLDGELRGFDERGRLVALEVYKLGAILERTTYYPSGAKFDHTTFNAEEQATGVYTAWFENESKRSEITMVDGVANGKHVEYLLDGSRMTEHTNVNVQAQGEKRHYLRDGTLYGFSHYCPK